MNRTIFLSCLVVTIGSVLWTANALDYEFYRERVIEVFKNADPSSIEDSNVLLLGDFLAKYINDIELTTEKRSKAVDVVKKLLQECAPGQVGLLTKPEREFIVQLGIEIASEGVKKATKS